MINARAETVAEKPSFRRALVRRRCLVLSDGFYEWRTHGGKKTPVRVVLKSGDPFAFAGLWETWRPRGGEAIRSCTIITTEPNSFMEPIHNRMPVILSRDAESAWLDRGIEDADLLTGLLAPYPSEEMAAYQVSTLVNSPRNDLPDCIAPLDKLGRSVAATRRLCAMAWAVRCVHNQSAIGRMRQGPRLRPTRPG